MSVENKIKFKENEKIVSVIRRYGLTFFWSWLFSFIFITAPFFFMFWLFKNGWWGQALFFVPLTLGLLLLFKTIFIWQKNILLITTHRIIDFDRQGFFEETVSNVSYDQLEDVMGKISGFFGMLFRYGNVTIQSGSGKVQIVIDKVKQPVYIQQEITELRDEYMAKYSHDFSKNVAEAIIDKIYELELPELERIQKVLKKRIITLEPDEDSDDHEDEVEETENESE